MGLFDGIIKKRIMQQGGLTAEQAQDLMDGTTAAEAEANALAANANRSIGEKSKNSDYRARLQLYKKNADMFFDKESSSFFVMIIKISSSNFF